MKWKVSGRILLSILLFGLLCWSSGSVAAIQTEDDTDLAQTDEERRLIAQQLLESMSSAERVGQLFVVSFEGEMITAESSITDLILSYHIGGVQLTAANNNITGFGIPEEIPSQVQSMTNDLQQLALLDLLPSDGELDAENVPSPIIVPETSIPLLIAINQEGGSTHSEIMSGLAETPTQMAIGATWDPQFARISGEIVGQELSALGINMLLGPTLDVLLNPFPFNPGDEGTRSFGGHPFWVGLMGQSFIDGVHAGSERQLAVVAKHFPGIGSGDRSPTEEVPTLNQSLAQLEGVDLAPFVKITAAAPGGSGITDALMSTHSRYQSLQGTLRDTTPPISFDPQALTALLQRPEFALWRQQGGLIVSDQLGVRAVERFYDQTEQEFPSRRIARDALFAGNDLLLTGDFALGDAPYEAQLLNIQDTLRWFQEQYETDPLFQQRVDEAVLRILQLKLRLYQDDFSAENVLRAETAVSADQRGEQVELAQSALTLLWPQTGGLEQVPLPSPNDQILIFTDLRQVQQCDSCPPQPIIDSTALEERILALYGPEASGQVQANQITSFSYGDLLAFLDAGPEQIFLPTPVPTATSDGSSPEAGTPTASPAPTATPPAAYLVQEALQDTTWIIFAMLDLDGPNSNALARFLSERQDLVGSVRIVVFAFDAPYYLDTTQISKLDAFFGVYSQSNSFLDTAARALFQQSPIQGIAPVDVAAVGYDIDEQTRPAPGQIIELSIVDNEGDVLSPDSAEAFNVAVGDTLRLQAGMVVDYNGNPVPDGTLVQFIQEDRIEGLVSILAEVPTVGGIAQLDYVLQARAEAGEFRITAESDEAVISQQVDISVEAVEGGEAQVAINTPIPTATAAPTITSTPSPTVTATETSIPPSPTVTATPLPLEPEEPGIRIVLSEVWLLTAVFAGLLTITALGIAAGQAEERLEYQLGRPLWGLVAALVVYNYYILNLPGTSYLKPLGNWAGALTTVMGGLIGLGLYGWYRARSPHDPGGYDD